MIERMPTDELERLLLARVVPRDRLIASLHPKQREVIESSTRFVSVLAGRRGGKTVLDAAALALSLEDCGPDDVCVYVARTREIARRLMWGKLKALQRDYGFDWTFHETSLEVRNPAGGAIWLVGLDKSQEMEKLRGPRMRLVVLDEPATYAAMLGPFARDVLEPALGDLRGRILATGTPGIVLAGWWYEVTTGRREKWRAYTWTVLDNPFFPSPAEHLADTLRENRWTPDNATYQREYLGRWVHSEDDLVYRIRAENVIESMPTDYSPKWRHVIGIDYGVTDSTAWVVLAWEIGGSIVAVESSKRAGLAPSQIADITRDLVEKYRPESIVGDAGGLGKAMIQEMNIRYPSIPIVNAEKTEKRAAIEHLNGDLQSCRLLFARDRNEALLSEAAVLPWYKKKVAMSDGEIVLREMPDPSYEDHACDALLYAWRATTAFYQAPTAPEPPLRLGRSRAPTTWDGWDDSELF